MIVKIVNNTNPITVDCFEGVEGISFVSNECILDSGSEKQDLTYKLDKVLQIRVIYPIKQLLFGHPSDEDKQNKSPFFTTNGVNKQ